MYSICHEPKYYPYLSGRSFEATVGELLEALRQAGRDRRGFQVGVGSLLGTTTGRLFSYLFRISESTQLLLLSYELLWS